MNRRRQLDERGAVAVFTALVLCFVILPVVGFAVDIGLQRVARRDAQAVADTAAQDAARALGNGTAVTDSSLTAVAQASASTDRGYVGSGTPQVRAYAGTLTGTFVSDQALGCGGSPYNAYFTPTPTNGTPNAVLVTVTNRVSFAINAGSGSVCRSSIGTATKQACFSLGSFAARVTSANSPIFRDLLNNALHVNLTAVGYTGLASSSISAGALAAQLGLGTVDQLATTTVTTRQYYAAIATILSRQGDTNASVLNTLATSASTAGAVNLGQVLALSSGSSSALAGNLNVLDLVSGGAFVADGGSFATIPSLGTAIGLTGTGLTSRVQLVSGPALACGKIGTPASTAQGVVQVRGNLADLTSPSSLGGIGLVSAGVQLDAGLASATGTLSKIVCGAATTASPEGIDVAVSSGLLSSTLTITLGLNGSLTSNNLLTNLLNLAGLGGLLSSITQINVAGSITFTISASGGSSSRTASIRVPTLQQTYATPSTTGTGGLALNVNNLVVSNSLSLSAKGGLLGLFDVNLTLSQTNAINAALAQNLLNGIVNPLLSSVNSAVLVPISNLLGLQVGGADVFGVPHPSCSTPQLAG